MSDRVRLPFVGAVVLVSMLIIAGPARGHPQLARGRCCFAVSVDVRWDVTLAYHGNGPGAYVGGYEYAGTWGTRFIAAYTGGGLDTDSFGFGLQEGFREENSDVSVMRMPNDPHPIPKPCSGKDRYYSYHRDPTSAFNAFVPDAGPFVADRAHVNGFARALDVFYPDGSQLAMQCGTAIEGPPNHGLMAPDSLTLQAPSVNNLLHGSQFDRICYQTVQAINHASPFLHDFTGALFFQVRFTFFRHSDLGVRERALRKHVHEFANLSPEFQSINSQYDSDSRPGATNPWKYDAPPAKSGQLAPLHCK